MSGTLTEYSGNYVVIGIGINIKSNPTVQNYKTTKLENYVKVEKSDVLKKLMNNLDKWRKKDFIDVRLRWLDLAIGLNDKVKFRGEIVDLIGINENGALILRKNTNYFLTYGDEISL